MWIIISFWAIIFKLGQMNSSEAKFFNKKLKDLSSYLDEKKYSEARKILSELLRDLNKAKLSPDNEKLKNEFFKI